MARPHRGGAACKITATPAPGKYAFAWAFSIYIGNKIWYDYGLMKGAFVLFDECCVLKVAFHFVLFLEAWNLADFKVNCVWLSDSFLYIDLVFGKYCHWVPLCAFVKSTPRIKLESWDLSAGVMQLCPCNLSSYILAELQQQKNANDRVDNMRSLLAIYSDFEGFAFGIVKHGICRNSQISFTIPVQ